MTANNGKLRRSKDRVIAGVCGGLAEKYGWSPDRTRLVYVLVSFFSVAFPGILVYLALWFLMPEAEDEAEIKAEVEAEVE